MHITLLRLEKIAIIWRIIDGLKIPGNILKMSIPCLFCFIFEVQTLLSIMVANPNGKVEGQREDSSSCQVKTPIYIYIYVYIYIYIYIYVYVYVYIIYNYSYR